MHSPATLAQTPSNASLPTGLTDAAVLTARAAHGRNVLTAAAHSGLLATLREVMLEPTFRLRPRRHR